MTELELDFTVVTMALCEKCGAVLAEASEERNKIHASYKTCGDCGQIAEFTCPKCGYVTNYAHPKKE